MDTTTNTLSRKARVLAGSAGLITAGIIGGAALTGTFTANAATPSPSTTSSTGTTTTTTATDTDPAGTGTSSMPAHGSASHESAESAITGTKAASAQAAAVKSVGSGTAGAVVSDFSGTGYEVTVTKADGSTVEVHLNSAFSAIGGR